MNFNDKIYVAGHKGLVGSAIVRLLTKLGYRYIITANSSDLDLRDQFAVKKFFQQEKPQFVFLAAAKVGGIMANKTYGAEFIYDNLAVQNNVINEAYKNGVEKLLFLGSSCIYPKLAAQPIKEEYLMTGPLEPTNSPYAMAKIAGIEMCKAYNTQYGCNFISVMPTNLYGPNDNYDLDNAHVLPALIRKFHEAKINNEPTVTIWGTGKPKREFLHVDDAAAACIYLMQNYNDSSIVNIGCGIDFSIKEMALKIKEIVGYLGDLIFDDTKPDGTMQKLLDVHKLENLGWKYSIDLTTGLKYTYEDFSKNYTKYIAKKN
ncbi:MAG: GDP-L-fucose synthase [Ferruginibacter sp.]|nr:GDP-L-fucose synthase [Ferruginibacter sp.]